MSTITHRKAARKRAAGPRAQSEQRPKRRGANLLLPEKPVGRRLLDGLRELADALESGTPLESRFTVRTVGAIADPGAYDASAVRRTRQRLGASQAVFARLLAVSPVLVRAWEHGIRRPSPLARRLLDEINCDTARWLDRIRETLPAA